MKVDAFLYLATCLFLTLAFFLVINFFLKKINIKEKLKGYKLIAFRLVAIFSAVTLFFIVNFFLYKEELGLGLLHHAKTHFDIAGILTGIVAIFIGVFIVLIVEAKNDHKNKEMQQSIDAVSSITKNLGDNIYKLNNLNTILDERTNHLKGSADILTTMVDNIRDHLYATTVVKSHVDRFITLKNIISHAAKNKENKLYVLFYGARYGEFLVHNLQALLDPYCRNTPANYADVLNNISVAGFRENYIEKLDSLKEDVKNNFIEYLKNNNNSISFGVLRNSNLDPDNPSKLRQFSKERMLKGKKVITIDKNSNFPMDGIDDSPEDVFIHWLDKDEANESRHKSNEEKENDFINYVIKKNTEFENSLNSYQEKVNFSCLDYLPFQFVLSIPEKNEHPENKDLTGINENSVNSKLYNCSALLIFTNYYSIGSHDSIISFSTENGQLCNSLRKMFYVLINNQKVKDNRLHPLKKIIGTKQRLYLILKKIDLDQKVIRAEYIRDTVGFKDVTPVPDIEAKDYWLSLLKEYDIKHNPHAVYIDNEKSFNEAITASLKSEYALLVIGLFLNPVTLYISKSNDNFLFRLKPRKVAEDRNALEVAVGGTKDRIDFRLFEANLDTTNKKTYDFGIFAKLKINSTWMFVCGGIHFLGTKKISDLLINNSATIFEKVGNQSFIALFKIYATEESELTLISTFDESGEISCYRKKG
jgi:hypothetical protein